MFCMQLTLFIVINNIVKLESGVLTLNNIVDSYEQYGQQNIA